MFKNDIYWHMLFWTRPSADLLHVLVYISGLLLLLQQLLFPKPRRKIRWILCELHHSKSPLQLWACSTVSWGCARLCWPVHWVMTWESKLLTEYNYGENWCLLASLPAVSPGFTVCVHACCVRACVHAHVQCTCVHGNMSEHVKSVEWVCRVSICTVRASIRSIM